MNALSRSIMAIIWIVLILATILMWTLALSGDIEFASDFFELETVPPTPPLWAILGCSGIMIAALSALGWSFWNMSLMLKHPTENPFVFLALRLRNAAYGFICFWLGSVIIWRVAPFLLTLNAPTGLQHSIDWFLIDDEAVLLAIAIVFLALSKSLMRAHEIELENKQII